MLNSSNRRSNALQTIIGLFLHAAQAPETVHELMARLGLAISTTTTHKSINSLAIQAKQELRSFGQTGRVLYAFDNVDIYLRHSTPVITNTEALIHLTSAIALPLNGGMTESLCCYTELQNKMRHFAGLRAQGRAPLSPELLLKLFREPPITHPSGLRRQHRFYLYMFLRDLIRYGPSNFSHFINNLEQPEVVEEIPLMKTEYKPLTTLDINPSTVGGNADVLASIFQQAGIGDSTENPHVQDIGENVVLVSGDLLTGERIRSLQESRSIEATQWRRLDFVIFVMGLFHFKMACADAIWRLFINAPKSRTDPTSLINMIGQIRPRETGKYTSGPSFRALHEAIQHVGAILRLDCWRLEAKELDPAFLSLEAFANSNPSWDDLVAMAIRMSTKYVGDAEKISSLRNEILEERDEQFENNLILQYHLLLYEETSYAMNMGDIGQLESLFCSWIFIFNCCGKNKYASELRMYLENIHFIYPKEIRLVDQKTFILAPKSDQNVSNAIRMNILCNPTGKRGSFRAIDWVVEHHNFFLKVSRW